MITKEDIEQMGEWLFELYCAKTSIIDNSNVASELYYKKAYSELDEERQKMLSLMDKLNEHFKNEPRIERVCHNSAPVSRVYVVETMSGETEDCPIYSIEEAVEFLEDVHETKNGRILDCHTDEVVAIVKNGKVKLVDNK